jgi:DNA-binding CsgD family transcriptional regulator
MGMPQTVGRLTYNLCQTHHVHYKDSVKSLGLSTSTVRVHLHSVYTMLHVQTRTQAVLKYLGR